MRTIGLDIGTTTLSAVVLEMPTRRPLASRTQKSVGFLTSVNPWEKLQDAEEIRRRATAMVRELMEQYGPITAVGLTGQMHGVLYVDEKGVAVSPLYTWQDERGNLPVPGGESFARVMSRKTGYSLATGYGMVTHAWNTARGIVPPGAKRVTTIDAYVGMGLTGRQTPILHHSEAASLGVFSQEPGCFDLEALARMGISPEILPEVTGKTAFMGIMPSGTLVTVGLGDNQASFLGSVPDAKRCVLVNMGTGGQISALAKRPVPSPDMEVRPFVDGDYLLVGSPLCSGRAYALLEKFIRECAKMAGAQVDSVYDQMNALAGVQYAHPLKVRTTFSGKRSDPSLRGAIENLGEENFTPGHFARGVLEGMTEEMFELYQVMKPHLDPRADRLVASGNAVRLNPVLRDVLAQRFGMPVSMPDTREEAACGAAVFAEMACKHR